MQKRMAHIRGESALCTFGVFLFGVAFYNLFLAHPLNDMLTGVALWAVGPASLLIWLLMCRYACYNWFKRELLADLRFITWRDRNGELLYLFDHVTVCSSGIDPEPLYDGQIVTRNVDGWPGVRAEGSDHATGVISGFLILKEDNQ